MKRSIHDIPEIIALDHRASLVRIPQEIDVPLTPRVRQLIDTPEFQRLTHISQLGLVGLVYPAARHSRFEHSLGVYRNALLFVQRLAHDPRFTAEVTADDAEIFIVAALLHDLGHWPFCHPIEDIHLSDVPEHESFAKSFLLDGEIATILRDSWNINPRDVVAMLSEKPNDKRGRILSSMLSGPMDVDKMDYLFRDALHAGVPYGRNFDQQRLIGSLCLNERGDGLALTEKGKTAAEMMVFSRYVMFSEVYWHHTVRAATSMLQHAFYLVHSQLDLDALFRLSEYEFTSQLRSASNVGSAAYELADCLFGTRRRIYKRWIEFSYFQRNELYDRLARRPFPWLIECARHLAQLTSQYLGQPIHPHEILIDAPPVQLEVQFQVEIFYAKENRYRSLGDVSPVVMALAQQQFDDYVKRVRLFVHPKLAESIPDVTVACDLLSAAIDRAS